MGNDVTIKVEQEEVLGVDATALRPDCDGNYANTYMC